MKTCCSCKIEKSLESFGKSSKNLDGLKYDCTDCRKLKAKVYRDKNSKELYKKQKEKRIKDPEKYKEQSRLSRIKNAEQRKESARLYRLNNKNKIIESARKFKENNPERVRESRKRTKLKNKDKIKVYARERRQFLKETAPSELYEKERLYRLNNAEKVKETKSRYKRENKGKINAATAKRWTNKLQATPKWITKEHLKQIEEFYIEAKRLESIDGIPRHVDHIICLQGETVSGLHIPWNLQILTAEENVKKANKLLDIHAKIIHNTDLPE